MTAHWMRRTTLALACAAATLLSACGSSSIESALAPERLVAFGDSYSSLGAQRYTVNNGSINNWTLQLLEYYRGAGHAAGGLVSLAEGNARLQQQPDAAGQASTRTVAQQIDGFLASQRLGANDVALVNGGVSDIIVDMAAVQAGRLSPEQFLQQARQHGEALAAQVRRLVAGGANYVAVSNLYDLGLTPWAAAINQKDLLSQASNQFNRGLLVALNDLSQNVLYIDVAYYVNLYTSNPESFSFYNTTEPVCTSVDAGNGIGIGLGQINSSLCTAATLRPNAEADRYVFADAVYLAPSAQRQLGLYAYDKLRARW